MPAAPPVVSLRGVGKVFGSGTVALCFLFLRLAAAARAESAILTLLFSVGSTQIFTSIIVESYAFAGFSIALIWLVALLRLDDPARLRGLGVAAALLALGITITNVVQSLIAELLIWWRRSGVVAAFKQTVIFTLAVGLAAALLAGFIWFDDLWAIARGPILALKRVWWLQTEGGHTGALAVLRTFFAFSVVAPHFSWLMLPEGINMRDFREWSFAPIGSVAVWLWLLFFCVGAVAAAWHRSYRRIALGLGLAIAFNVIFHMFFQYRGSLFLYTSHLHFLIFAVGAGVAPWLAKRALWMRSLYCGVALLLLVLVGANNIPKAIQFVSDFDNITAPCSLPCDTGAR